MDELFLLEDVLREAKEELIPGYHTRVIHTGYPDTRYADIALQLEFYKPGTNGRLLSIKITKTNNVFSIVAKLSGVKDKIEMHKLELDDVIPSLVVVGNNVKILEEKAEKEKSTDDNIKDKLRKQVNNLGGK